MPTYLTKLKPFLYFIATVLAVALALLGPIDETHYTEEEFYREYREEIAGFSWNLQEGDSLPLEAGWHSATITPEFKVSLAGYGNSEKFEKVADSVAVQAIAFRKGALKCAMLSIDLLIFPPSLQQALSDTLPSLGWSIDQLYLCAIHTHSSIGGWQTGLGGRILAGEYDDRVLDWLLQQTLTALLGAEEKLLPVKLSSWETQSPEFVKNRINKQGKIDSSLKGFALEDSLGRRAVLGSYAAHPTCVRIKELELSADYPQAFKQELEDSGFDFAFFLAGPMGSHAPKTPADTLRHLEKATTIGQGLGTQALQAISQIDSNEYKSNETLGIAQLDLPVEDLQLRVSDQWGIREWVFEQLLGNRPVRVSCMQVGSLRFIGLPCDFSGELALELYEKAEQQGHQLIISSFNGGYIGYITPDEYYHTISKHELREMNWTGPHTGGYFMQVLGELLGR